MNPPVAWYKQYFTSSILLIRIIYCNYHSSWRKTDGFPNKIRNKTRLSALTIPIQNHTGSPSQCNKMWKEIKIAEIKEEIKVYLYNCPWRKSKNNKQTLEQINNYSKAAGWRLRCKSQNFLIHQHEKLELEIKSPQLNIYNSSSKNELPSYDSNKTCTGSIQGKL